MKEVGIERGQRVLDFGCKTGNYTMSAARIVGRKGAVYALDKNSEALDSLMLEAGKEGLPVERIDTEGKLEIPLPDETVDVVLLYDVIHLVGKDNSSGIKDRKRLYEEVARVAKDNALISVYPPHLATHTDISSIEELKEEFAEYFQFERELSAGLIHDDNFVKEKILNFRK